MMTDKKRAELIGREADKYTGEPNNIKAFQAGAKWADENPQMTKQDFINNAKEFFKMTFDSQYGENSVYAAMDLERLLWEFEKWMA